MERKPSIIFLDNILTDGDGVDFAIFVRNSAEFQSIPIVSISGSTIDDQKRKYERCKINEFCQKPLSKLQMLNILNSCKH